MTGSPELKFSFCIYMLKDLKSYVWIFQAYFTSFIFTHLVIIISAQHLTKSLFQKRLNVVPEVIINDFVGKMECVPAISWAELCLRTETQSQMRQSLELKSVSLPLLHSSSAEPELSEHHPVRPGLLFSNSQQSLSDNCDLNVGGALGSSTAWPHLLHWSLDSDKWVWPTSTHRLLMWRWISHGSSAGWALRLQDAAFLDLPVSHLLIVR